MRFIHTSDWQLGKPHLREHRARIAAFVGESAADEARCAELDVPDITCAPSQPISETI